MREYKFRIWDKNDNVMMEWPELAVSAAPALLSVLRSVLNEMDRPNFTDRYGTVDRIKSVIEEAAACPPPAPR